jgi:hypothetical protein
MVNRPSDALAALVKGAAIWPQPRDRGVRCFGRVIGLIQKHLEQGASYPWGEWRDTSGVAAGWAGLMVLE